MNEVLAANLTAPYAKTTQGATQASKDRFVIEVYDEVKNFPAIVDGKQADDAKARRDITMTSRPTIFHLWWNLAVVTIDMS